jgi:hypothetical protein
VRDDDGNDCVKEFDDGIASQDETRFCAYAIDKSI